MLVTGGMRIHGIALRGIDLITSPLLWLVAMLFVGVTEEYFFRGYALQSLWQGAGFWPAALITTAIFAGDHLEKPGENAMDIGMIFFLALILCLSVRRTGSLWWATKNEWLGLLDVAGLRLEALYGGYAGEPLEDDSREYVVVARR